MKVRADQLERYLQDSLQPIYLVSGDEPLLVGEALDAIRQSAREQGFTERSVHVSETGFDWNTLLQDSASMSLFGEKKIVELRMRSAKPGTVGAKILTEYADNAPPDTVLLISTPKIERPKQPAKWVSALEAAGVWVQVWPVADAEFSSWLRDRMRRRGLQPDAEAIMALAKRVEGNLLAANQEIDKLWTLAGDGPVSAADIEQAVTDSARFNVFKLVDLALAGDAKRVVRVMDGLRREGTEPVIVSWAIAREVRALFSMACQLAAGKAMPDVFRKERVWSSRQGIVRSALARHTRKTLALLLQAAAHADASVKGQTESNGWDALLGLAHRLASDPRQSVAAVASGQVSS